MGYSFGSVRVGGLTKTALAKPRSRTLLCDHYAEGCDYYLFLMESDPAQAQLDFVRSSIISAGFRSFVIAAALSTPYCKDDVHGSIFKYFRQLESGWRDFLTYHGTHAKSVMTFGAALYVVNRGTDLMPQFFHDALWYKPYYYLNSDYLGDFNCFIYPVDPISQVYPMQRFEHTDSPVNYTTRIFQERIKMMLSGGEELPDLTPVNKVLVRTRDEADALLRSHFGQEAVAWDTETDGLDFFSSNIFCFTMSWDGVNSYFILRENLDIALFSQMLMSCRHRICANGKFDYKLAWKIGMPLSCVQTDDTQMLAHAYANDRYAGLKPNAFFYTPFGGYDTQLDMIKDKLDINDYSKISTEVIFPYSAMDAACTYRVFFALLAQVRKMDREYPDEKMKDWSVERWYHDIMMPVFIEFSKIEYRGFVVDTDRMEKNRALAYQRRDEARAELLKVWKAPADLDIESTEELGKWIEKMGWDCIERSEKGFYATNKDCLAAWKRADMPGMDALYKFREYNALINGFIGLGHPDKNGKLNGWEQYLRKSDADGLWHIYQQYLVMGTNTFRMRSTNPNMQNVPMHNESSPLIKSLISVPPLDEIWIAGTDGTEIHGLEYELVVLSDGTVKRLGDVCGSDTVVRKYSAGGAEVKIAEATEREDKDDRDEDYGDDDEGEEV